MTLRDWIATEYTGQHSSPDILAAIKACSVIGQHSETVTTTHSKPQIVQVAEAQYLEIFRQFYGSESTEYMTVSRDEVALHVSTACASNPALFALTYPMERSFDVCAQWWAAIRRQEEFHPYPWGQQTVDISITTTVNEYGPCPAEINNWGDVRLSDIEGAM